MPDKIILYPIFPLLALTVYVLLRTFLSRLKAVKSGAISPKFYKTYSEGKEPEEQAINARHLSNLMETPPLFYITCLLIYVTGINSLLLTICAWLFVGSRFAHSYIHLGSNNVIHRYRIFFAGMVILLVMWIVSFIGIIQL